MIDKPFRVHRHHDNHSIKFAIVHTADGVLCTLDDVTYAYRIVELLNDDVLRATGTSASEGKGSSKSTG